MNLSIIISVQTVHDPDFFRIQWLLEIAISPEVGLRIRMIKNNIFL